MSRRGRCHQHWLHKQKSTPLIAGDQATFVWTGEQAPILIGDMTGWRPWEAGSSGQKMEEVEPGVWSCTLTTAF